MFSQLSQWHAETCSTRSMSQRKLRARCNRKLKVILTLARCFQWGPFQKEKKKNMNFYIRIKKFLEIKNQKKMKQQQNIEIYTRQQHRHVSIETDLICFHVVVWYTPRSELKIKNTHRNCNAADFQPAELQTEIKMFVCVCVCLCLIFFSLFCFFHAILSISCGF